MVEAGYSVSPPMLCVHGLINRRHLRGRHLNVMRAERDSGKCRREEHMVMGNRGSAPQVKQNITPCLRRDRSELKTNAARYWKGHRQILM